MATPILANRARFSLAEVAAITGGTLTGSPEAMVDGIVSDSRAPALGKLFVALPGDRYDGHTFITAAIRAGACALLVERDPGRVAVPVVRVNSSYAALGALARAHRRRWNGRLLAVAGSAGKTTTRSATAVALEAVAPGAVHFAPGNLNNRIGVPFVLLALASHHQFAVVEIGTNALGEVAELTDLAAPDVGILTLIGLEHTQGLGLIDQIEREEGSLLAKLPTSAIALGNADDSRVMRQLFRSRCSKRYRYGFSEEAEYRVLERSAASSGSARLTISRPGRSPLTIDCPLVGRAGASALAAGIAAAESCSGREIEPAALASAFSRVGVGEPGRLAPRVLANGLFVLDDTYNSNPASLSSSVSAATEIARARKGRLVLVLGEMRELGEESPRLHREAGEAIRSCGAALVLGVGGDARWILQAFEEQQAEALFAADAELAVRLLLERLQPNDVVLVKASRGVRAERIVEALSVSYGDSA